MARQFSLRSIVVFVSVLSVCLAFNAWLRPGNTSFIDSAPGHVRGWPFIYYVVRLGAEQSLPHRLAFNVAAAFAIAFVVTYAIAFLRRAIAPNKSLHPTAATSGVMESQSGGG
jgi:hypothetical protein